MNEQKHVISPEWLVATRSDRIVDENIAGGWGVSPAPLMRGASYTDFSSHEIAVPFGDTESERAVRLHELLHARISPARVPGQLLDQLGVSRNAVQIAEEVRVNLLATHIEKRNPSLGKISELTDGTEAELAKTVTERGEWPTALHLYLTTLNTKVHKKVKRKFRTNPEWKEAFAVVDKYFEDNYRTAEAIDGYRSVRSHLADTDPHSYKWIDERTKQTDETIIPEGFINVTLPLAETIDNWLSEPPRKVKKVKTLTMPDGERKRAIQKSSDWETLRFGMTSLTETTSTFIGKRKRPAMTGKFPVRPDRLLTDPERRIFRETVRSNGGVVVFDCSGSMSVTHDDIHACMKQFSGATVVAYTYKGEHKANAWVLAKNGRMISESEFQELELNNGNGVDGPILRWAIRQRKTPKDFILWVSDGAVTGKHDHMTDELLDECADLSMRYNIIGVENSEAAIGLLQDMKRTGAMPRHSFCRMITNNLRVRGNQ